MEQVQQKTPEELEAEQRRKERAKRLIRSLMERTEDRGCSEAEALEAVAKISALMAQNNLELTEVMVRDTSDMVQREVFAADGHAGRLIVGIGKLCALKVYHKTRANVTTYVMFGHAPDVELGVYLYEVCMEAADHGYQLDMDRHGYSQKRRESWRAGYGDRIAERMSELHEAREAERRARMPTSNCTDLVVLKNQIVEAEFEKTGIRLVKRRGRQVSNADAFRSGSAHGDTVNLNNPIADGRGVSGALA